MYIYIDIFNIRLLCNISQIATGVPYSESPRKKSQSGPILINIGRNLTCVRPVQSFTYLGGGPLLTVLGVLSKITTTQIIITMGSYGGLVCRGVGRLGVLVV
jgi:hypothetical protein